MQRKTDEIVAAWAIPLRMVLGAISLAVCSTMTFAQAVPVVTGDARVDKLLGQMTLAEKLTLIHGTHEDPALYQAQAGYLGALSELRDFYNAEVQSAADALAAALNLTVRSARSSLGARTTRCFARSSSAKRGISSGRTCASSTVLTRPRPTYALSSTLGGSCKVRERRRPAWTSW